ncbi:MAG TPA: hypothetical protein VMT94_00290 [Burkholderiales bacterium]|nr:hypothetical protein [Burkholderiales bacterium]
MNDARARIIMGLFAFVPYFMVSWAYMALVDGGARQFWSAFGVLAAVRLFFSLIETLGSVLSWRLYGRKFTVNKFLGLLRANNFPKREHAHDDFLNYLARIEDGPYSQSVKGCVKEIYFILSTFESMGILLGMRMHSATEAALDAYSPRSQAPDFGADAA